MLRKYRSPIETNALIHQLIYTYKRLQKENYSNLENISLFELIDKTTSKDMLNFVLRTSEKLQKYYIHRLNKEGIPIRKIGKSSLGKLRWPKNYRDKNYIRLYIFDKETKNKIDSLMKYPQKELEKSLKFIIKTQEDFIKLSEANPSKYEKPNDFLNKISTKFNFYKKKNK